MISVGVLFACSKKLPNLSGNTPQFNTSVSVQADDQARISGEIDNIFNVVNTVLGEHDTLAAGERDTVKSAICGAVVTVDAVDTPNNIFIQYRNGGSCDGSRSLNGTIGIYFNPGTRWSTANDTTYISVTNLGITRVKDGQVIFFNGNFDYNNVSGGTLASLQAGNAGPIVHTITGFNIGIQYNDSLHTAWTITRKRQYTYSSSNTMISTTGVDTAGGQSDVAEFGGNRYGNSVIVSVDTPLVISSGCNWQIMSGQVHLTNPIGVSVVKYGLDSLGIATGCPVSGVPYYYSISWSGGAENPLSGIFSYY
jgi:hypothetical protein